MDVLKDAFENVKPQIETKSRRVGGTNYQVPMEVPNRRSTTLAIRWIVDSSRKRGEKIYDERNGEFKSADAYQMTLPAEPGEGASRCMTLSLEDSNLDP